MFVAPTILLPVLALLAGCADDGGPRLTAVAPASGSAGDTVTITGTRLCGSAGDCATAAGEVDVGTTIPAIEAIVVSYADATAQIQIPATAAVGATELIVVVDGTASNGLAFEVLP